MFLKSFDVGSQLFVGTVAAAATTPTAPPQSPRDWVAIAISAATVILSVSCTTLASRFLAKAKDKKTYAEAHLIDEQSNGDYIRNIKALVELKDQHIRELQKKVDDALVEMAALRREIAVVRAENAQLTLLLGSKLKDLVQIQSMSDVFESMRAMEEDEKAGG